MSEHYTQLDGLQQETVAPTVQEDPKSKKGLVILAVVLALCVFGYWCSQNFLWGNDKAAYEIMVACADNFRNPSSLRLISGSLGVDKDCMWVALSAKNGLGSEISRNYFLSLSGVALSERDGRDYGSWDSWETERCSEKDFNAQKVNRIYEKKYGSGVDDGWENTYPFYESMGTFSWILLIAALVIHVIAANAFQKVALQKGHDGYFARCFFLGLAGWLMVVALPDRSQKTIQGTTQPEAPSKAVQASARAVQTEEEHLPEL